MVVVSGRKSRASKGWEKRKKNYLKFKLHVNLDHHEKKSLKSWITLK